MNIKNDIDNEVCNFTNDASLKLKGCYLNYIKEYNQKKKKQAEHLCGALKPLVSLQLSLVLLDIQKKMIFVKKQKQLIVL